MKYSLGSHAAFGLVFAMGAWSTLQAQQTQPRPRPAMQPAAPGNVQPAGGQTRPGQSGKNVQPTVHAQAGDPPVIEQLSPELEQILQEWEEKSSRIKSLHGTHKRTVYNTVFEVEKIAAGKFFLQTPDKGRIDLEGLEVAKGAKSARIGKSGKPYRLEEDHAEKWICTGDEIVMVNDDEKTYEVMPLPESVKGSNIINSPLPFLFGMKADEAKRRFQITLKSNSKAQAVLIVTPRMDSDRQNYKQAFIMLEKENYLPTAVKLFDPSGSLETVYMFENVKINDNGVLQRIQSMFRERDPFHPDLKGKGYKLVVHAPEENEPPRRAAPADPRSEVPVNRPTRPVAPQDAMRNSPGSAKLR